MPYKMFLLPKGCILTVCILVSAVISKPHDSNFDVNNESVARRIRNTLSLKDDITIHADQKIQEEDGRIDFTRNKPMKVKRDAESLKTQENNEASVEKDNLPQKHEILTKDKKVETKDKLYDLKKEAKKEKIEIQQNVTGKVELKKDTQNKNCSTTIEQVDMLKCTVTPHDDDDDNTTTASTSSTTVIIATNTSTTTPQYYDDEQKQLPPKIFPNDKNVKSIASVSDTLKARFLNGNTYDTPTVEITSVSPIESSAGTIGGRMIKHMDIIKSESMSQTTPNNVHEKKKMSSSVIALVITVSFAIAVVIAYAGMIVWRRYLEYRYGHRELLVNELEFDTNDLRHFEL